MTTRSQREAELKKQLAETEAELAALAVGRSGNGRRHYQRNPEREAPKAASRENPFGLKARSQPLDASYTVNPESACWWQVLGTMTSAGHEALFLVVAGRELYQMEKLCIVHSFPWALGAWIGKVNSEQAMNSRVRKTFEVIDFKQENESDTARRVRLLALEDKSKLEKVTATRNLSIYWLAPKSDVDGEGGLNIETAAGRVMDALDFAHNEISEQTFERKLDRQLEYRKLITPIIADMPRISCPGPKPVQKVYALVAQPDEEDEALKDLLEYKSLTKKAQQMATPKGDGSMVAMFF